MPFFRSETIKSGKRSACILCAHFSLLFALSCGTPNGSTDLAEGNDPDRLRQKLTDMQHLEKALQQEAALARKSAPYILVDLQTRAIELKARGRILRSFGIRNFGDNIAELPGDVQIVSQIKPYQLNSRPKIDAGKGEAATLEAAQKSPWGLHRMPLDYDLICQSGMTLQLRALPSEQAGNRFFRFLKTMYRKTLNLYRQRNSSDSSVSPTFQIWLDENDCRLLFWSMPKQPGMVFIPVSLSEGLD